MKMKMCYSCSYQWFDLSKFHFRGDFEIHKILPRLMSNFSIKVLCMFEFFDITRSVVSRGGNLFLYETTKG